MDGVLYPHTVHLGREAAWCLMTDEYRYELRGWIRWALQSIIDWTRDAVHHLYDRLKQGLHLCRKRLSRTVKTSHLLSRG